ncbi:BCCT family transporter [Bacillus sp. SCS-153A]|uniref:BCCT family transporter n=1 Tax=Rossellomorea sedimentorum TaxID=3115294 RepID=UPI003905C4F9
MSGGFLLLFVLVSVINQETLAKWISDSFSFSVTYLGAFWQLLLLATFLIGLGLAVSRTGRVRLGNLDKPEIGYFRWMAMILCTLLASGGVFWAAAEPMYHFLSTPPLFAEEGASLADAVIPALAQSYLHWGFLAWAILGSLTTIILMYAHYHKGYPLKPRAILYPIFGEKIYNSWLGTLADVVSIIAVSAGTIGPIGFLGLQVGYGLHALFDIPNTLATNIFVILVLVAIASVSAATGIERGIQMLSRINVSLTVVLMVALLILGPTMFIIDAFMGAQSFHIQNFFRMTLYRGDYDWLGWWTVFFWGWFLGYGPMMAIFISRISRGRTIRDIVIGLSVVAPIVSNFWFTVVGGSGIFHEMQKPGSISNALNESGMPAAVISIMNQIPFGYALSIGFLIVTIVFVATTADSMSYTVGVALTGSDNPAKWIRVFWALIFGALAIVLLTIGEGSIGTLQNFIVVTAVPVSLLLLPSLWLAPKVAREMLHENEKKAEITE